MKIIKTVFFTICLVMLNVSSVLADEVPEQPTEGGPKQPPNQLLPIDNHITFLLILAIVLGIVIIYQNKIKKASI